MSATPAPVVPLNVRHEWKSAYTVPSAWIAGRTGGPS